MEGFELQNIEYKVIWKKEYLKEICGMANADGGKIFIGKDDDGNTVDLGVKETKNLLESIPNSIVQTMNYYNISVDGRNDGVGYYIEINVHKSETPVFYLGNMYKRIGTSNFCLDGRNQQNAIIEVRNKTWDSTLVEEVSIKDLDEESFQIFRDEAIKSGRLSGKALESREKILEELELVKNGKLTIAAVLLFHRNPSKVIPGASVMIGKMRSDADIVSRDDIKGSLMMLCRDVIDIIWVKYLSALISYDMNTRIETYPYPHDAMREAIFNALMHNDWSSGQSIMIKVYDNKIYIQNRAILAENWTVEHHKSRHINPLISNAFNKAGFVEKFGTGIPKILGSCEEKGNPAPIFEIASDGMDFSVTFRPSKLYCALDSYRREHDEAIIDYKKVLSYMDNMPCKDNGSLNNRFGSLKDNPGSLNDENSKESGSLKDNLGSLSNGKSTDHGSLNSNETAQTGLEDLVDNRKKKIINAIKDNPETTIEALSYSLSIPERTIYREIEWLKENGCLERIGSKKFGRWNVIKELK